MKYKKTEWGMRIINFKESYGLSLNAIAKGAGVKCPVMRAVMIGKIPGYEIVPKVDEFMANYKSTHQLKPLLTTFEEAINR